MASTYTKYINIEHTSIVIKLRRRLRKRFNRALGLFLKKSNIIKRQRILYILAFKELELKRSIITNTLDNIVLP
jgi:chorismate-pyruvate lyase